MKIYTKKGDSGQTFLYGGEKISKSHIRIESYGTIDELNAIIGCILVENFSKELKNQLLKIQKQLFILGAELATPTDKLFLKNGESRIPKTIETQDVSLLENWIDQQQKKLPELKCFILPGGSKASTLSHLARTICRRSERLVVSLNEQEKIRKIILIYLNRLSDYFFVLSRSLNFEKGEKEIKWIPEN